MKRKKLNLTTRYVLAFGLLMLAANTLLGIVLLRQSIVEIRSLIDKNMLDVVESASGILDGDVLGALTEADVDGEAFRHIEKMLMVFQNHADIKYIYAVRQVDDGKYVFTVDPDPVDPGVFGEEIVVTEALVQAGKGIPTVDTRPMADRWGNYYSAYSPVLDSSGNIAGIVGIDFDADWYEAQVRRHTVSNAFVTILSVLLGGVVVFLITHNVRKRFLGLDSEISRLSTSVDQMMVEAGAVPEKGGAEEAVDSVDEIEKLTHKIRTVQKDMDAYERLQKDQYYNDAITGIPNLNYVKQFAEEKVNKLWAAHATPAVIYLDIRSMVSYNNEYGYIRGDELLRLTGENLRASFPNGLVGRGEGDHFIVIDEYDDGLGQKTERINEEIKKAAYGRTTGIHCAIVKMVPGMKGVEAIQRARSTLKKIGYDLNIVYRMYSYEEDSDDLTTQYVLQYFEEALQNNWIKVYYQPIVRTSTRKITILEALARWVDPIKGVVSPGQFIPVLSRYHQLHKLDQYMVEQICREFLVRREAGLPLIPVSVNFSAQDFDYIDVPETLNRILERYDLPRSSIIVEITEQDLAQATGHFKEQIAKIHTSGYQLWIDDFGAGYSSLNVFSQYHIDRIKFDMDLVRHLDDNNGANRIIMRTIVDMCRQMGIHTLAEGIETEAQYRFMNDIRCEMTQGYYFYKPEPVEKEIARVKGGGALAPSETTAERAALCERWITEGRADNRRGDDA